MQEKEEQVQLNYNLHQAARAPIQMYLSYISKSIGNNTALIAVCVCLCVGRKNEPAWSAGQGVCLDTGAEKGNSAADIGCQNALATAEQTQAVAAPRLWPRAWLSRQLAGLGWQSHRADVCFLVGQALSESKMTLILSLSRIQQPKFTLGTKEAVA